MKYINESIEIDADQIFYSQKYECVIHLEKFRTFIEKYDSNGIRISQICRAIEKSQYTIELFIKKRKRKRGIHLIFGKL